MLTAMHPDFQGQTAASRVGCCARLRGSIWNTSMDARKSPREALQAGAGWRSKLAGSAAHLLLLLEPAHSVHRLMKSNLKFGKAIHIPSKWEDDMRHGVKNWRPPCTQ